MGFDLHMIPAGFRNWSEAEWDAYFSRGPEDVRLGKAGYVGRLTEAIVSVSEHGSRFPLLLRMEADEVIGWEPHEVPALLRELQAARDELTNVPITVETLRLESESELQQWISIFRKYHPEHPLESLADLFFRFFEDFTTLGEKAIACGQGLFVSY